ncbi:hypothetical protein SSPS47_06540 [Streptomyces sp. S4.7]|uniref:hypothetical protein n=1 Tax=Streptomyces sp. S4.7 TaxID=2705439 RepID=UPI0013984E3C|nr:hypothetical protein [Streptomyces sp. S4.7]QHY94780.1 hypothetical protein SSPS47_06540 [Streptomyces sp. S4.7]
MYRRARKVAASLTVAVLIVAGLAVTALVRDDPPPPPVKKASVADTAGAGRATAAADGRDGGERDPFGASCRTAIKGSSVTAYCHNPYPGTDRVQLHVECARWWDVDSDSAPAEAGPARHLQLTGRCWKEVDSAWVSHARVDP